MCGIYGTINKYSDSQLHEKLSVMHHRGPDHQEIDEVSQGLYFGHVRLSIIDLDKRSNQPFRYNHNTIVFNGEIYNFLELKAGLAAKGYSFKTESDTEVICALYDEYGVECVNHLQGMFAFVLYDSKKEELFGARDRLGQKPLYYTTHNGFEFSSNLKVVAHRRTDLNVSEIAIKRYLQWGNIPDPYSIYEEVSKLMSGHYFTYALNDDKMTVRPYWSTYRNPVRNDLSYDDAREGLKSLVENSVNSRLLSDVPLGTFLSGGIDSSLVTALAQKNSDTPIRTFSVKFLEDGFDESLYAQKVADYLGTDHTTIVCSQKEVYDLIDDVGMYYDEPFADSSALPSLLLSMRTKEYVTVALSGDGGDESFMGYSRYAWFSRLKPFFKVPVVLRAIAGTLIALSPKYRHKIIGKTIQKRTIEDAYLFGMQGFENEYITQPYPKELEEEGVFRKSKGNLLRKMSLFDLNAYLNWDINTKVDRASMAASLEVRSPLLDYRVVEYALSLKDEYKFHNGNQKRILKDMLFELVPKEFFDRPKSGFSVPLGKWFRNELKKTIDKELSLEELQKIPGINPRVVNRMLQEHMSGKWNRTGVIWKLLVLKKWLNNNVKS